MQLKEITTKLRENLSIVSVTVGAVVSIISAAFAVDQRYAHAEDVEKFKAEQNRAIVVQGQMQSQALDGLRRQMIEDKVFELELIPQNKRTVVDNAKLERYKRQLATPPEVVNQK